ncbi:MAG: hypothetical protein IJT80_02960 [Lachnospiraceae bacterium]|nr:hypothetical protein [Lachnospiraceae bacterium]
MRMLKKLLLAGAFIGVLGSFGFAQEAKADVFIKPAGGGTSDKIITISSNNANASSASMVIAGVTIDLGSSSQLSTNGIEVNVKSKVKGTLSGSEKISSDVLNELSVSVYNKTGDYLEAASHTLNDKLYKVSATTSTGGSVKVGDYTALSGSTQSATAWDYGYSGDSIPVVATESSGYRFDKWTPTPPFGASSSGSITLVNAAAGPYVASFVSSPVYDDPVLTATIGSSTYRSTTVSSIEMNIGEVVTFSANTPSGATSVSTLGLDTDFLKHFKKVGTGKYEAIDTTYDEDGYDWPVDAWAVAHFGTETTTSDVISFTVLDNGQAVSRINLSDDFKDYITDGYTLQFTAKFKDSSLNLANANAKLVFSEGSDYVDNIDTSTSTSDKNVTFKVKFKSEKLDKGTNSKEVKFKILIGGESGSACPINSDTDTEKKITIYSNPTNSYNNSDRTMSYKVPAKVNTGTETGKDSNLSYTQDAVSEVKGIRINVLLNDSILGTTTTAAGKGTSATVDASTMESIITNLGNSGKFTGDCTVAFRAYPSDGSGNCNKKVYHETYAKVYKVILRPGQTATAGSKTASAYALPIAMIAQRNTGATTTATTTAAGKEYVLYGLEGQTLTAPSGVTDIVDVNGNPVTKIVVNADSSKNVYTYGTAAATKEGLDRVPKTGQSNVFVYVMAVVVCGAVGYGLYAYNKKSKKSI